MRGVILLLIIVLFTVLEFQVRACELDKMSNGFRITNGQCSSGFGCKTEFRYESMEKCKLALTGERHNACSKRQRCLHGGSCLQITSEPGFKCSCEGTGFYGSRCDKPCPGPENPNHRGPYPYECVVI